MPVDYLKKYSSAEPVEDVDYLKKYSSAEPVEDPVEEVNYLDKYSSAEPVEDIERRSTLSYLPESLFEAAKRRAKGYGLGAAGIIKGVGGVKNLLKSLKKDDKVIDLSYFNPLKQGIDSVTRGVEIGGIDVANNLMGRKEQEPEQLPPGPYGTMKEPTFKERYIDPSLRKAGEFPLAQVGKGMAKDIDMFTSVEYAKKMEDTYKIKDPNLLDQLMGGYASASAFILPGIAVSKMGGLISQATKIKKLSEIIGVGVSSLLESGIESGATYEEAKERGMSEEDAKKAAGISFGTNLAVLLGTNKLGGLFKEGKKGIKDVFKGFFGEGTQEALQEYIGVASLGENPFTLKTLKRMGSAGTVGGLVGGSIAGVQTLSDQVQNMPQAETVTQQKEITPEDTLSSLSENIDTLDPQLQEQAKQKQAMPEDALKEQYKPVEKEEQIINEPLQKEKVIPKAKKKVLPETKKQTQPVQKETKENFFELPEETRTQKLQRIIQDKFNRLKGVQETVQRQGKEVTEKEDAYLKQELLQGKIKNQFEKVENEDLQPILKELTESKETLADKLPAGLKDVKRKVSLEDLEIYLYAKHAPERNTQIMKINPKFKGTNEGSGMHTDVADKILKVYEEKGLTKKLDSLSEKVYSINEKRLNLLEKEGLITKEFANKLRTTYKYYVTLKGIEQVGKTAKIGKGFDIRGKESFRALGRKSAAQNILANTVAQYEEAIIRVEKNKVGKAFLEFVRNNPNRNLWEINKVVTKQIFNEKTGEVQDKIDPRYKLADNVLSVKEDGEEFHITIEDEILAKQLKNLNPEKSNSVINALAKVNRFLSAINTQLSPEFIVSNFSRDIQTAMINIGGEKSGTMAKNVLKDTPKAIKGIWKGLRDTKAKGEWETWFKEYKEAGGKVEFFGLESIQQKQKAIENEIKRLKSGNKKQFVKVWKNIKDVVDNANTSVENGVRLAVYKNARQNGVSKAKAASIAKNITVNFNKRGELGNFFNSLYMFANAQVQGTARILKSMKSKRVQKIMGGIIVGSMLMAELNKMLAGDDKDDENYYDKISDFEKERNFILMIPNSNGKYLKFPLPYGFNIFWVAGNSINNILHDKDYGKESINIAKSVINAFNPLGESSLIQTISPTIIDPLVQLWGNENFFGGKIRPDQPTYGLTKPKSQLKWKSVSLPSEKIATALNEYTGGNQIRGGLIDVSPEDIDHMYEYVTGGLGKFISKSITTITNVYKGKKTPLRTIPFVRKFIGEENEFYTTNKYRENVLELRRIKKEYNYFKDTDKKKSIEFKRKNKKLLLLEKRMRIFEKRLNKETNNDKKLSIKKSFNKIFKEVSNK